MKTIYKAILARLKPFIDNGTIKWIDWDKGQLKKTGEKDRPDVNYPCALIRISLSNCTDVTDHIQDCKALVTITLAFNVESQRTSADVPEEVREQHLEPYDVIADVYSLLQGYYTDDFSPLSRKKAGEVTHPSLFVYQIPFETEFEDNTAEK